MFNIFTNNFQRKLTCIIYHNGKSTQENVFYSPWSNSDSLSVEHDLMVLICETWHSVCKDLHVHVGQKHVLTVGIPDQSELLFPRKSPPVTLNMLSWLHRIHHRSYLLRVIVTAVYRLSGHNIIYQVIIWTSQRQIRLRIIHSDVIVLYMVVEYMFCMAVTAF